MPQVMCMRCLAKSPRSPGKVSWPNYVELMARVFETLMIIKLEWNMTMAYFSKHVTLKITD